MEEIIIINKELFVELNNVFRLLGLRNVELIKTIQYHIKKLIWYIKDERLNKSMYNSLEKKAKFQENIDDFTILKIHYQKILKEIKEKDKEMNTDFKKIKKLLLEESYTKDENEYLHEVVKKNYGIYFHNYYTKFKVKEL